MWTRGADCNELHDDAASSLHQNVTAAAISPESLHGLCSPARDLAGSLGADRLQSRRLLCQKLKPQLEVQEVPTRLRGKLIILQHNFQGRSSSGLTSIQSVWAP